MLDGPENLPEIHAPKVREAPGAPPPSGRGPRTARKIRAITDLWLKSNHNKPRAALEEFADRDGLGVRVSTTGKIVFQMRYLYPKKQGKGHRLDLGTYPKMPLQEARHEATRLRILLNKGHDPRVVRRVEIADIYKLEAELLETLFMSWYEKVCVKRKPQHKQILRSFQIHVFPEFGKLPADEVTLHHWIDLLEELAEEIPHIAIRILTNAKQMLKWGCKRERISKNPLANISAAEDLQIEKNIGKRSFSNEEFVRVWNGIDGCFMSQRNKIFLKLCAIYGARHTELRKAEKSHFNFETKVWTVPWENHKTGKKTKKPLLRPITPEIEPLIRMAFFWSGGSEYLFPVKDTNEMKKTNSQLSLPYSIMNWLKKKQKYVMEHWSIKAFRKTARTNFSTLTLPHVAEIMLGHRLPGEWQVYDHHTYLEEQAAAYSAWCQRIMKLLGTETLLGFRPPKAISIPMAPPLAPPLEQLAA